MDLDDVLTAYAQCQVGDLLVTGAYEICRPGHHAGTSNRDQVRPSTVTDDELGASPWIVDTGCYAAVVRVADRCS